MVATSRERPSRAEVPGGKIAPRSHDDLLSLINAPLDGGDPAAARHRGAELLAGRAGSRERLEELRFRYLQRLHRASDDFEATQGLRVVEAALSLIPYPEALAAAQRRWPRKGRRWWRRRTPR